MTTTRTSHPSLIADATSIGRHRQPPLPSQHNLVTAENAGASPLIANRTAVGLWEQFDVISS